MKKINIQYTKIEFIVKLVLIILSILSYLAGFFKVFTNLSLAIAFGTLFLFLSDFIPNLSAYRRQKEIKQILIINGIGLIIITVFIFLILTF